MNALKWTMRNGSWTQIPMILQHTPTGWKERPADKEDNENERTRENTAGRNAAIGSGANR